MTNAMPSVSGVNELVNELLRVSEGFSTDSKISTQASGLLDL